ncbi:hypothetical protein SAY86_007159 [Trapa natans]|uniref:Uncharacterized protein n=1 Tax=Trapa natans TaxID=22666 RepID=A0AAN7LKV7_TRANT|nr:hypothetical protein SAY86_007159 [Trapa natans]
MAINIKQYQATRILHDQQVDADNRNQHAMKKEGGAGIINIQSLQRGSVPPSGSSGCTNIPGSSGPSCPVSEMHFAGGAFRHPHSYPRSTITFGVVSDQKQS